MSDELDDAAEAFFAGFDKPTLIVQQPRRPGRATAEALEVARAFILFGRAYAERPEWSRWRVERAILEGWPIRRGEGLLTLIEKLIELSRAEKDRGRLRSAMLLFLAARSLAPKAKEMT